MPASHRHLRSEPKPISKSSIPERGQSLAKSVLVIDIGGTGVKILATEHTEPRRFVSGPTMTPRQMVRGVQKLAKGWKYDVVSIGYPGVVKLGRPAQEPKNLAPGWVDFDFEEAFGCEVRMMNDAAMQALGSYQNELLLFLGLGTGLGSAVVTEHAVIQLEIGRLPFKGGTYEDYLGRRGLKDFGKKKWRRFVDYGTRHLMSAIHPDDVVLGGGNAKKLKEMPPGCRLGNNANAFTGGFRLWEDEQLQVF